METRLRSALIQWLRTDPALQPLINTVEEESPLSASPPWLGIVASASADWSTKDRAGREVRLALELVTRGDDPASDAIAVSLIENRISTFARVQNGFDVMAPRFLRARSERRDNAMRAFLLEYRFRLFIQP
ncbi:MAG: DUF3168 domain-containing protein [Sphingomonadaceae bacterium]